MNLTQNIIMFAAITAVLSQLINSAYSKVQKVYTGEIGVRETGGANRGPQVEKYIKSAGGDPGNSWCSFFLRWCFDQAGVKTTINGWSATAYNSKNVVYDGKKLLKPVQPGDVFTLYGKDSKGTYRIYHTGFVDSYDAKTAKITTVEGNTNPGGSANGDGVYKRQRNLSSIHNISRWI